MRKLFLLLLLVSIFNASQLYSQISFSREYGGNLNEDGRWMEQLPDSGFILTGGTTTFSNGQMDIWLVRTDAYGNNLWQKSIGSTSFDLANMVKPVSGGFVICGVTNRNGSDDAIIIKTNSTGNTVWTTIVGDAATQWFEGVIPTADGGYAAVGVNTGTGTHGTYDIFLVKFDGAGVKQWEKSIGGQSYEIGNSIQQTADGGFILSGQTYSYGNLDGDFYLVKTNANGVVQWQQTYAQPHLQECHYAQVTPDGGYIMVGDADTLPNGLADTDIWLIKTDSLGDIVWDKVFGGSKKDGGKTVENTSDGGYLVAGITRSFGLINPNYYLFKTNDQGLLDWQVTSYGTAYHDHAYRGVETSDGGCAEFGYFKNSSGAQNFALVKLGPNGGVTKDIAVDNITAPSTNLCRSNDVGLGVKLTNYGATNEQNITVTIQVTFGNTTTAVIDTFVGSLTPGNSTTLNFTQSFDFNVDGPYTLKAFIQHRNSDISYTNDSSTLVVNVVPPTSDPTTTSAVRCSNGSLTLNSTPAAPADSMFWYDADVNGNMISTGNTYVTPSLSNSETYYVQSVKGKGSMVGLVDNSVGSGTTSSSGYLKFDSRVPFKLVSVLVYPQSSGSRTIQLRNSGGTVLQSKTITLPTSPGGVRVYLDFDVPQGNDLQLGLSNGSTNLFRTSTGAVFPYSVSQTVEIYGTSSSNAGTYYYFYNWYIFVPGGNCESNRTAVDAIIGNGSTTAFDASRCGNGPVTLTANSTSTVDWYTVSSGGSPVFSGSSFTTPSLSSTTTYYLEASSCPNRIAVDAIINTQSSDPTASDVSHCGPGTVSLNATATDPVFWYTAATNGVLAHSGSHYVTPYLNATTTYYAVAGDVCPSNPIAVNAIINGASPPLVTGASACGPASVTLNASSPDPVSWFTVPTGGNAISTSHNYTTPIISNPVTYYVEAGTSTCPSIRVAVLANVTTTDPPVGTGASRCGNGTLVLSAQSTNQITWWTLATGGNQVASGQIFTTPVLNSTVTYYAMATGGGCNSQRTGITATVNITSAPTVTSGTHCGPGTVTLHASAPDSIYWFANASGGSHIGTGTTFVTPSISTTTTYYAQVSLGCPSSRVSVNAVISSQAANPVTADTAICGSGSVTLTATATNPITWYDAPNGNIVGTGNTFQTPTISTTTTYYAVAGVTGCLSQAMPAVVTINPMPTTPVVTADGNCGPGQMTLSATSSDPLSWYSQATGGTLLTTGPSYSSNFNTTTTVYVQASNGTCTSNRVAVTASVYNIPVIGLPPSVLIQPGQTITLDAGPGFTTYLWSTNAHTQTINVNTGGVYWVTVTDVHSCQNSDSITVNVNSVGIVETSLDKTLEVYPNPSQGKFTVKVNNSALRFDLQIMDITGKTILLDTHKGSSFFNKDYSLSEFAKGIYFIRIFSSEGTATRRIIIQ